MTLIIFAKYSDGFVIIADKQSSRNDGQKRTVKKIFENEDEYYLALAGDGDRIDDLRQLLEEFEISKNEIPKMKTFMNQTYTKGITGNFEGVLILKNSTTYECYIVKSNYDNALIVKLDSKFESFGVGGAGHVANFLANIIEIEKCELENAIDGLVSIMKGVSIEFDGISEIDVGFDIIAFSNNGDVFKINSFTEKESGEIKLSYSASKKNVENIVKKLGLIKTAKPKIKTDENKSKRKHKKKIPEKEPKTSSSIPPSVFNEHPQITLTQPSCQNCGKSLSILESLGGNKLCNDCSPQITLTQPSCQNCGKSLSILESLGGNKLCNDCSPQITLTQPSCQNCGKSLSILESLGGNKLCNDCRNVII